MQLSNTIASQWGLALVVCFTITIGLVYQNTRISDLKWSMDKRFDDLKDYIKSEFKRVDERIDRLESPITHK